MLKICDFPRRARGLRSAGLCGEMGVDYEFGPVSFPADDGYRAAADRSAACAG